MARSISSYVRNKCCCHIVSLQLQSVLDCDKCDSIATSAESRACSAAEQIPAYDPAEHIECACAWRPMFGWVVQASE